MISWNEIDTMTFCDSITQFLSEHSSPGGVNPAIASTSTNDFDKVTLNIFVSSNDSMCLAANF